MNTYLETAIAIVLIILVFSIVTYIFQELIAAYLAFRGTMLRNSLLKVFDSRAAQTLTTNLYDHPQIKMLRRKATRLPPYISSRNFSIALMDLVAQQAPTKVNDLYTDFKAGINPYAATNPDLKTLLESLEKISSDAKELQTNMEKWYNDYMDRVTSWYKKKSTVVTRVIAVILVLAFNLDMIKIITTVHRDTDLKARLNATANVIADNQEIYRPLFAQTVQTRLQQLEDSLKKNNPDTTLNKEQANQLIAAKNTLVERYTQDRINEVSSLLNLVSDKGLPIGWKNVKQKDFSDYNWAWIFLGWFIGVAAISMGAPFWFDLLMKLVNVRKAGIKPQEKN